MGALSDVFNEVHIVNKTSVTQTLYYQTTNGTDSLELLPNQPTTVRTKNLISDPSPSIFNYLSPSIKDPTLRRLLGLVVSGGELSPAATTHSATLDPGAGANTVVLDLGSTLGAGIYTLYPRDERFILDSRKIVYTGEGSLAEGVIRLDVVFVDTPPTRVASVVVVVARDLVLSTGGSTSPVVAQWKINEW